MNLFKGTIQTLENSLAYAQAKNNVISTNIANIDTPYYKAKGVQFKDILEEKTIGIEAKRTHPKHFSFGDNRTKPYYTYTKQNTLYNHNGNNVDVDKEMSDLAKNQIYYQSLIDRLNGKFNSLETVIKGGR